MSPRIPKKERTDVPKTEVRAQALGMMPVTHLSLAYLAQSHCDLLIGFKDSEPARYLKEHTELKIAGKPSFSVKGIVFNGLSDAFYRGQLPQVILAVPEAQSVDYLVEDILEHLEKLFSLGFFIQKPNYDPVEALLPCFVVAANGIFYHRLLYQLDKGLHNMNVSDDRLLKRIYGKFARGLFDQFDELSYSVGSEIQLEPKRIMKIAGGNLQTQMTIQSTFSSHGLITSIESSVDNPAERLEFENAMRRLNLGILPTLIAGKTLTLKQAQALQAELQEAIFVIGQRRKAFDELETLDLLLMSRRHDSELEPRADSIIPGDLTSIKMLAEYASDLNLTTYRDSFVSLLNSMSELRAS